MQAKLETQRRLRQVRPQRAATMPLKGLLFDAAGQPMSPAFAYGKGGRLYRYYVSSPLQRGARSRSSDADLRRVSACAFEELVARELRQRFDAADDTPLSQLLKAVRRVKLTRQGYTIVFVRKALPRTFEGELALCEGDPTTSELQVQASCRVRGGRTWISHPPGSRNAARHDPVLIRALRQAHRIVAGWGWNMSDGALTDLAAVAPKSAYDRRLCRLAFLAPDLQQAIMEGGQPPGLTLEQLMRAEISLDWKTQRAAFCTLT